MMNCRREKQAPAGASYTTEGKATLQARLTNSLLAQEQSSSQALLIQVMNVSCTMANVLADQNLTPAES